MNIFKGIKCTSDTLKEKSPIVSINSVQNIEKINKNSMFMFG